MRGTIRLGLALGFVAVAVTAAAAVSAPGGSGNGQDQRGHRGRPGRAMMRERIVHGEWVVRAEDGSFDTHRVNNGEITAVVGSKVTIKRADGETLTFTVPADARVRRGRAKATVEALKVGDRAHIVEVNAGDGFIVKAVMARPPKADAEPERPGASFEGPLDGDLLGA